MGGAEELARAVRRRRRLLVIDHMVVDELVRARSQEHSSGMSQLTARESQILAEMAQGKSNAAIAASL